MFGGHMKRIGIMGTAIMSLLLAAGVPGHAQQDQPNGKQDRDQKDENRGGPERPQNRPQSSRGDEPRQAERTAGKCSERNSSSGRWKRTAGGRNVSRMSTGNGRCSNRSVFLRSASRS